MTEIIKSNYYSEENEEKTFKEQVSEHIQIINKELDKLTKLLESNKKDMDFKYTIDIKYSNVFEYWKCNLVLEKTSRLEF